MPERNDSIKVLVVDSQPDNLQKLDGALQGLGVPADHISKAETIEAAFDLLNEMVVRGERERIHWLLCDEGSQEQGFTLMGLISEMAEGRPYISAMTGQERPSDTRANEFLAKGSPDFYSRILKEALERAKAFNVLEAQKIALNEGPHEAALALHADSRPEQEAAKEDPSTWYENLGSMMDLRKSEKPLEVTNSLTNNLVAVFDLDGTLAKPFTMERFVLYLVEPKEKGGASIIHQLTKNLPKEQQSRNLRAAKELALLFKQNREGKYPKGYDDFIEETDNRYAEMLQGLSANEVFKLGEAWCQKDVHQQVFSHARPLIRLCKALGITPTLVTGTPAEALAGFRNTLEIKERCHPLELYTDENGIYTGMVKHHTGKEKAKNTVLDKIVLNGNRVIFAAGDQGPDSALFDAALSRDHDSLSGIAFYFGDNPDHIRRFSHHLAHRRIIPVAHKDLNSLAIVEMLAERLHAISQYEENRAALSVGFREKINDIISERAMLSHIIDHGKEE